MITNNWKKSASQVLTLCGHPPRAGQHSSPDPMN